MDAEDSPSNESLFNDRRNTVQKQPGKSDKLSELGIQSESFVTRQPSIILPHLQSTEKKYFECIATGNVNAVKEFLRENPGFNINCVNFQGVSGLHLAIQIKSEPMVEFLLSQKAIDVGDCALHAVRENLPQILGIILNHIQDTAAGLEFTGYTQSSDYPDHITPLVLAAQCGHYEIIEILIERGHRITNPHRPDCTCEKCRLELENDDLLHAETRRLNLYRAISNPAYICHSTDDPILQAFLLSHELKICADLETEFRAAYLELSEEVSNFAVDLIGFCRSTEEMELILKQQKGIDSVHFLFPRLILAMDYKQKRFVAHPNTQQILETTWHGNWHEWRSYGVFRKIILVLIRIVMLPIITIMIIVMPNHPTARRWALPVNKIINHSASYLLFCILTFLQSNQTKSLQKRGPPNSGYYYFTIHLLILQLLFIKFYTFKPYLGHLLEKYLFLYNYSHNSPEDDPGYEPIIILYVFGFVWSVIRLSVKQGPARYFRMMWSWYNLIMLFLFLNTFFFWIAAYIEQQSLEQPELERKYWHYLDPTLVAEGMFCIATIMAFFRLLFLCQLNYNLGPLQISLGKMAVDIAKFTLIFTIIIIAFSAGLCRFYHYYDGMVQVDETSGIKTVQVSSFTDFEHTLKTLFWALFCMAPLESADVIIENLPGDQENTTITNQHTFTEAVGYIAFACFEVLCVIIILNMLIATMSNTFQKVTDNVDVEWTFGRTQVYLQFIEQTILPSPYNLIPTASGIASILEWFTLSIKPDPHRRAMCTPTHCCYIDRDVNLQIYQEFPVIISQLAQRYFREKGSEQPLSETEILRQDINELKMLIHDMTTNNN